VSRNRRRPHVGTRPNELFRRFAHAASDLAGSALAFIVALVLVLVWAVTGALFAFSDTWQLVINTGTTVATFLMVFLIQNAQNRDSRALHAKLDELILHDTTADNHLVLAEDLSDEQLARLKSRFEKVGRSARGGNSRRSRQESKPSRGRSST
jgi:low affinity Fe/Cu permease